MTINKLIKQHCYNIRILIVLELQTKLNVEHRKQNIMIVCFKINDLSLT